MLPNSADFDAEVKNTVESLIKKRKENLYLLIYCIIDVTAKTSNTSDDNDVMRFTSRKEKKKKRKKRKKKIDDSNVSNEHEHSIFMDSGIGIVTAFGISQMDGNMKRK